MYIVVSKIIRAHFQNVLKYDQTEKIKEVLWDMPKQGRQILAEALKLPPVERAELVESLLTSFEFESRKKIDALWAKEAEDRIDAFERGEMPTIPARDVFEEIEKNRR
jgi:putative addiction module component (TIGR02574 family)